MATLRQYLVYPDEVSDIFDQGCPFTSHRSTDVTVTDLKGPDKELSA